MNDVAVVHLVRKENGPRPLATFLESLRAHDAQHPHRLALIFKGFQKPSEFEPYRQLLAGTPHREILVSDRGFDLGAYVKGAAALDERYVLFLNSFSVILRSGWLAKMIDALRQHGVGLVGATGSWQGASTAQNSERRKNSGWLGRIRSMGRAGRIRRRTERELQHFDPFPNPHIRTSAFLIERSLFLSLQHGPLRTKADCWRFESGKTSMTRQVATRGLKTLVVGASGEAYEPDAWRQSETFRSGQQQNLLIADNRTREFDMADAATRRRLAEVAWGIAGAPDSASWESQHAA